MTNMLRQRSCRLVAFVSLGLLGSGARAASCNLSIGNLNFGAYVGSQVLSTSNASFSCTNTNPALLPERIDYVISLSTGAGTYLQRQMTRTAPPTDTLPYNLYLGLLPAVLNRVVSLPTPLAMRPRAARSPFPRIHARLSQEP